MTFDCDLWPFDLMNKWRFPYYINKPSLVQIGLQLFKWGHFQTILQLDLRWPLTVVYDLRLHEHYEGFHITSINHVWFQTSTFQMRPFSHFQPILQLDLWWPLISVYYLWPHEHMTVPILYELTKFGSNTTSTFQMRPLSHFQSILQLDLRWPVTLICDLWPCQQIRVPMLHLWPNFGWNPTKWKLEPNVNLFSQQTTSVTWSLCETVPRHECHVHEKITCKIITIR